MAGSVKHPLKQAVGHGLIFLVALFICWKGAQVLDAANLSVSHWTGWLLIGLMLILASLNLRKKLPIALLGTARTWLRIHLALGYVAIAVTLIHAGRSGIDGPFETLLATCVALLFLTGILGWALSRVFAHRLSIHGGEVIYEQIPGLINNIRLKTQERCRAAAEVSGATTLPDFYRTRLADFFKGPSNRRLHLFQSKKPLRMLTADMDDLVRYVGSNESEHLEEVRECVNLKNILDYQHAHQWLLKGWLLLHIPLTYVSLFLIVLHVFIVYAF